MGLKKERAKRLRNGHRVGSYVWEVVPGSGVNSRSPGSAGKVKKQLLF